METTISKWGNSLAVRLPKEILNSVDLRVNQHVKLVADGKQIVIEKIQSEDEDLLYQLFKHYDGEPYNEGEIDWGSPVGNEIW